MPVVIELHKAVWIISSRLSMRKQVCCSAISTTEDDKGHLSYFELTSTAPVVKPNQVYQRE